MQDPADTSSTLFFSLKDCFWSQWLHRACLEDVPWNQAMVCVVSRLCTHIICKPHWASELKGFSQSIIIWIQNLLTLDILHCKQYFHDWKDKTSSNYLHIIRGFMAHGSYTLSGMQEMLPGWVSFLEDYRAAQATLYSLTCLSTFQQLGRVSWHYPYGPTRLQIYGHSHKLPNQCALQKI